MLEKIVVIICWLLCMLAIFGAGYDLINAPNTFANFGGVVLILVTIYVTIKTKCLTTLFKKQK